MVQLPFMEWGETAGRADLMGEDCLNTIVGMCVCHVHRKIRGKANNVGK